MKTTIFALMIQRKQSLFLLAVAIIGICMLFLPFQKFITPEATYALCLLPGCSAEVMAGAVYGPMILDFLAILLSLVTIFQYKNRRLQYKLTNVCVLFNVFITGLFFLLTFTKETVAGSVEFNFGAFLPLLGAIFAFLAAHFIKKDELLVRSADRIR